MSMTRQMLDGSREVELKVRPMGDKKELISLRVIEKMGQNKTTQRGLLVEWECLFAALIFLFLGWAYKKILKPV